MFPTNKSWSIGKFLHISKTSCSHPSRMNPSNTVRCLAIERRVISPLKGCSSLEGVFKTAARTDMAWGDEKAVFDPWMYLMRGSSLAVP